MNDIVTLGARNFVLRPLKLGQLRGLLDALDAMAGTSGGALVDAAAVVVAAGLAPGNPELTAEAVLDCEASLAELNAAVAAILRLAGLQPAGEPKAPDGPSTRAAEPGQVGSVGCETASPRSTPPSPPAAATPIPTSAS